MKNLDEYEYKGNAYFILSPNAKMKLTGTGEWVDAVVYTNAGKYEVFIREKSNFLSKFKPVTNDQL